MEIMSVLNSLNRLHTFIQQCFSIVNCFGRFFIKRNSSVFLAELCWVLTCACTDINEYVCQWLHVSAINCFRANLIFSSRTPSVAGLYKRRIKDASRLNNKSGKGFDSLNMCALSLHYANRGYCCLATWARQQSPTSAEVWGRTVGVQRTETQ